MPHRSRRARHRLPPIESHGGAPAIPSSSRFTPYSSSARSGRRAPRATSLLGVTGLAHVPRQHLADSHVPYRASEIRRAHDETATELDLSSALCRLPRADGGVVVQQCRGRRCPEASVAAARQHHCIWPQLCRLTQCILHYQADRKERRRIAAREGRPLEPTPHACTGSRGSELPPTLPLTCFEWEARPLFYPRDAHDRTERGLASVWHWSEEISSALSP